MVLTFADLESNNYLTSFIREVIVDVLATNDKALVMNLLDNSKKVIIDKKSLIHIIYLATKIPKGNIQIISNRDDSKCECGCCGKAKVSLHMFETIEGILINGMLLNEAEPDLYSYIQNTWNISLVRCYCQDFLKISRLTEAEKEAFPEKERSEKETEKREIIIEETEETSEENADESS